MRSTHDPDLLLMLENAEKAAARLGKERDAAFCNLDAATAQLDAMREAWHAAMAQIAREQAATQQAMKRALELHREVMRGSAAVRCGLSPAQWQAAIETARRERPDLWRCEE